MKSKLLLITAISVSVALASCGGGEKKESVDAEKEMTEQPAAESATWTVDSEASNIRWEGGTAGANVYSHYGNIAVESGKLMTEGGNIAAGSFVVDMSSIQPKDENYSEDNPAEKLVGHLSTADFFNVKEYPTSNFEVTSVEGNTVTGNLTIRGNTNEEKIMIDTVQMMGDGTMKATGKLVFDRQKYDVAWEHYLEDTVLSDDIELTITLVANKA